MNFKKYWKTAKKKTGKVRVICQSEKVATMIIHRHVKHGP